MAEMVTYTRRQEGDIADLLPALADLYAVVYAEPPYHEGPDQVERFREALAKDSIRPGFSLILANEADHLVGAAYGWTMPAGSWWSGADNDAPKEILDSDKLAIMEWIVHPNWRTHGIGAHLLDQLLDRREERWATLASDPRSIARSIYRRSGWRAVAETKLSWGPRMDILVLEIPPH